MPPALLLTIYCLLIVAASLAGGWIPMIVRLTHRRMQIAISFVAGVMLGVGVLHMLPHACYELEDVVPAAIDTAVWWAIVGFLGMFFLERFFHFHHHDVPDGDCCDSEDECCHDHEHEPTHEHAHAAEHQHGPECDHDHDHGSMVSELSWGGAAIGMTLHSVIDGIALAAGVVAEQQHATVPMLAGMGAFLAVFLHKPFDSLTISTLMTASGWSNSARHLMNGLYALVPAVGILLFYLGAQQFGESYHVFLGRALGFAAGAFICIATSDLLPELQFHSHDRGKLSLALIAGVALAWGIVYLESSGHGQTGHHSHEAHDEHEHETANDPEN